MFADHTNTLISANDQKFESKIKITLVQKKQSHNKFIYDYNYGI